MKRTILMLSPLAVGVLIFASCGHPIDTDKLGDSIGGKWGNMFKAAGHGAKASLMSESDEDELGQSVAVSLTNTYPVLKNDALTKYVTLVGYTVASTSDHPSMKYVFGILDTPEVNAFSGPHGYVFITRGALANMQDEAELAGVLGHEMSHVLLHHGLKQIQSAELKAAASDLVKATSASKFSALADLGVDSITKVGYTQQQEYEADANSVKLISAAGYNPGSYLHFLQRLALLQAKGGGVMSTHPGGPDRVNRVTDQLKTISQTGVTLADRFQQSVKM